MKVCKPFVGASQVVLVIKNLPANAGDIRDTGSIPGLGDALEEGTTTHSCILAWRIPMDRGAWWATVHGVTESDMTSVQFSCSLVSDSATPWTAAAHQASLSITNSWSLLKLMSTGSVMPSNHLNPCCPVSSHLQFFPASGSLQRSQFFASGDHTSLLWKTLTMLYWFSYIFPKRYFYNILSSARSWNSNNW